MNDEVFLPVNSTAINEASETSANVDDIKCGLCAFNDVDEDSEARSGYLLICTAHSKDTSLG